MQDIIDQLTASAEGLSQEAWYALGGFVLLELVLGVALGFCLRRPKKGVRAKRSKNTGDGTSSVLGACGAAEFSCKAIPTFELISLSADISTLTGYSNDVLLESDAFLRMLDERDAIQLETRAKRAIQEERPLIMDLRYEDADGRMRWLNVRGEPTRVGRMMTLSGIVREVTEIKRLAADGADAWARFHALANSTPAMLWVLDTNTDCRASNGAAERFAGATGDHLLGQGWSQAFPDEERALVLSFVARSIEERNSLKRESVMIDAKGRTRTVSLAATVARDDQGETTGVVLTGKDITDLSETDRQLDRLRKIVDTSEHHMLVLAPDMRVAHMNSASKASLGLDDRDTPQELALWHVVTKDTSDQMRAEGVKACTDHQIWQGRGRVRTGEDESIAAEICMMPLGDGWHGMIARPIEHELLQAAEAEMDRRRLGVALSALERLSRGGWAPGRAPDRIAEAVAKHYTHLRMTFSTLADDGTLMATASDGPAWMGPAHGRSFRLSPKSALSRRLRDGEIVRVEDVWDEPELERALLQFEETSTRSIAGVMVDTGDDVSGVIMFEKPEPGPWTHDETETLRLVAGVLGVALTSERDRAERMTAETRIAEETSRWRTERERSEELSQLASDRASEADRLLARLDKVDSAWAGGLAELARRAANAGELAPAAREAGMPDLADDLERLARDADQAEVAGRIVSGTLRPELEVCAPQSVLRHVGERFVGKAKARGVALKINQEGALPDTIEADPRLLRLACCELLDIALARCADREMVAVASVRGEAPNDNLVVRVTGGPISEPDETRLGAPTGLAFLRQLVAVIGGTIETSAESGKTELSLSLPIAGSGNIPLPEGTTDLMADDEAPPTETRTSDQTDEEPGEQQEAA